MQNCDEALPSIIMAGDQFAFYTFLLAAETNLSSFNTGLCTLLSFWFKVYILTAEIEASVLEMRF